MDDFFIDKGACGTTGDEDNAETSTVGNASHFEEDFINSEEIDLLDEPLVCNKGKESDVSSKKKFNLENTYLITCYKNLNEDLKSYSDVGKLLEKSKIKPGLEKQIRSPPEKGNKLLKLERKKLMKKTKGKEWFDMPAGKQTKEVMDDLKLLKMRAVLDRKQFYKKNDITGVSKYFQIGKIVEGPADFYNGRIPKSQRKKTLVDELLADAEFQKYQKMKFKEIVDEKRKKSHNKINKKSKHKNKF